MIRVWYQINRQTSEGQAFDCPAYFEALARAWYELIITFLDPVDLLR